MSNCAVVLEAGGSRGQVHIATGVAEDTAAVSRTNGEKSRLKSGRGQKTTVLNAARRRENWKLCTGFEKGHGELASWIAALLNLWCLPEKDRACRSRGVVLAGAFLDLA